MFKISWLEVGLVEWASVNNKVRCVVSVQVSSDQLWSILSEIDLENCENKSFLCSSFTTSRDSVLVKATAGFERL